MKAGGQNNTMHSNATRIPADVDQLVVLNGTLHATFPEDQLGGWASDFKSAYNQYTTNPLQTHLLTMGTWHPILENVVYFLPTTQLFGGRLAGLNFHDAQTLDAGSCLPALQQLLSTALMT